MSAEWLDHPPAEDGWYWVDFGGGTSSEVVQFWARDGAVNAHFNRVGFGDDYSCDVVKRWQGPLKQPKQVATCPRCGKQVEYAGCNFCNACFTDECEARDVRCVG